MRAEIPLSRESSPNSKLSSLVRLVRVARYSAETASSLLDCAVDPRRPLSEGGPLPPGARGLTLPGGLALYEVEDVVVQRGQDVDLGNLVEAKTLQ